MKNKRLLYIIPALGETTRSKNYREIIKSAKQSGLTIKPITIDWDIDMTMPDYIEQADKQIPDNIPNDFILGFSFGAYIASILSIKKRARGYIFCSISPYFKDDIRYIPDESKKYFGKKMMDSFKKYSFPKKTFGQAWFLVGEKDWDLAKSRASKAYAMWNKGKTLKIIKGAGHELTDLNYTNAINSITKRLRDFS
ncbi:MAG: hypothetical protein UU11_C0003G0134 [Parcubacteria group bacterium GW2011_GWF2_40_69]|nr:MAG: hypothetical protein UT25_C0001G0189 [Parcubacteria group bacterium GW2011_GWC1_39_12]KKR19713.1 MAG: hypothetical protein UT49_C0001G0189 [Parcubacteria group bacterium GW2011_GWF1_39_37]KKR35869.1 MAG: hypothetical protein UT68_C0001G0192 [Parcubacteria group bacterium GW2011_GWC2_40_10]KKR52681.1 MAG: hypothetical protein UT89_C0001G0189 [Parcubacteria group bacterium GW2011_GWE1_40_20]KKR66501.1 MAG: hypothetical protein UU06_C0001G0034 [Parcubacteria group bacterium GW2011_GWB1_40_